MLRQSTSELYRKRIQAYAISDVSFVSTLFALVIGVLVFVDNQQTIDNTLLSGQIQTEIYSDRHTINTQKKLSKAMLFLNRTTKMYNSSNQPIANLCTVDYTVCETNNSLLVSTISKVYLLHGALQQQLFSDEGYQPLSIYYNSSSTEIVLINIYQQNITDSILTFANNSQFKTVIGQAITPDMSSSQQGSYYYFSYSNYFIACKWFESIVDVYSCMASLNSQLFLEVSSHNYTVSLNGITLMDSTNVYTQNSTVSYLTNMKDDLLGADLLGNEFWMNNTHPQLYDDCVQEFLQGPGGLMQCYITPSALRIIPVVAHSSLIQLPTLSDSMVAY